jgi:hypothetical protein
MTDVIARGDPGGHGLGLSTQARLLGRLATALPRYLRQPFDLPTCRARIHRDLAHREGNLRGVLERGVFAVPGSPYRHLLRHAGLDLADITELLRREGVEGSLARLHDAGVYVSLDEFKGRRSIRRGSLELAVTARSFDNPMTEAHYTTQSGGSRSGGTRIKVDLAHLAQNAAYDAVLLAAHGLLERPYVLWQPTPPAAAGLGGVLRYAKLGRSPSRWFAQSVARPFGPAWQHALMTGYILAASRIHGRPLPWPEVTPITEAARVAACLAELKARGTPAVLNSNVSSGLRVCLEARERGLDLAGTYFRLGGEPLTPARERLMEGIGVRVLPVYGMSEIGRVGLPCLRAEVPDEVHLVLDKLGVIQCARGGPSGTSGVSVNVYTTLVPTTPKLMLNVESDDYGTLSRRDCGCPLHGLGYQLHLHTIRSHEKLTSEGMNFLGHDLIRLIEEVLPGRFGGTPTDFQLVEDEDERGLPEVRLVVSPRLGPLAEPEVVGCIVDFLNGIQRAGRWGERWREAGALRVVRREPYTTSASKILALHTRKPKQELAAAGERRHKRGEAIARHAQGPPDDAVDVT